MGTFDEIYEQLEAAGITRSDQSPASTFFCDLTPPQVAEILGSIGWDRAATGVDLQYKKDETVISIRSGSGGQFSVLYFEVDAGERDVLRELEADLPPLSEFQALPIPQQEALLRPVLELVSGTQLAYALDDLDGHDKLVELITYRNQHIRSQVRRSPKLDELAQQVRRSITDSDTGKPVEIPLSVARAAVLFVVGCYDEVILGPWSVVELDQKREVQSLHLADTMDRDYLIDYLRREMPEHFPGDPPE